MSKLILAVFVCFFCFALFFFFSLFFFWGGGEIINCTSRSSLTRQMPRSKDRCEEDKRDEKGEKKNKIRMKARRCVGRRLDTRMDYEWESARECGRVRESTYWRETDGLYNLCRNCQERREKLNYSERTINWKDSKRGEKKDQSINQPNYEIKGNDHQLKKLLIFKQILLVSTLVNV